MITIELTGAEAARQVFSGNIVDKALKSTLNKLAAQAKTAVSKKIRETYNIKARDLGTAMTVVNARSASDGAQLIASGPRLPLLYFDAQETIIQGNAAIINRRATGRNAVGIASRRVRKGSKQRGVTVKVLNAGGRKAVKGPLGFGGFFAKGQSSGTHQIFMRARASRLPIDKLTGPAVPETLGKNVGVVQAFVNAESARIFSNELDFYTSQVASRGI